MIRRILLENPGGQRERGRQSEGNETKKLQSTDTETGQLAENRKRGQGSYGTVEPR